MRPMRGGGLLSARTALTLACVLSTPVSAQDEDPTVAALRQRGEMEGWTFTVGTTTVSGLAVNEVCGLRPPRDWWVGAHFDSTEPNRGLPTRFDWRESGACPPIRSQGNCGSCWAFGTVAPLESNILIRDGVSVDLSEQWLVSCNRAGYGCDGGWWAHEYHQSETDACGSAGAVLESAFPYVARQASCRCPYEHPYVIRGWAYVGGEPTVPGENAIKQAILTYGPVSAAVYADIAFMYYTGGIFNACTKGTVNHAVVLVGWDDNNGQGYWILRNSWGIGWGEQGYMRIRYGCSNIGYAACYVDYPGANGPRLEVTPASLDFGDVAVGQAETRALTIRNVGGDALTGSACDLDPPFALDAPTDYSLAPGQSQSMVVRFAPTLQGTASDILTLTGGGGRTVAVAGRGIGDGPSDACTDAPPVGDGTFTGHNAGAGTEYAATCGGGTADVWWRYVAPRAGIVTMDTCGSDFDTVLSVCSSCTGLELACSNDYPDCPGNPGVSRVTLDVLAGQTRYIRVAGCAAQTGNIVLNILTTVPERTISGRITTAAGTPVPGVTLAGLPGDPVTDANGDYVAAVPYGFSASVTPRKTAYTFQPPSRTYANLTTNPVNQDYMASPPTLRLSGRVTDAAGNPMPGVKLVGLPGTPVTGVDGTYYASVPLGFAAVVTPTKTACAFVPPTRTYSGVCTDLLGEDYRGQVRTGTLQVVLSPDEVRTAGARWQVDGGTWRASGDSVSGLEIGAHTVYYAAVAEWTAPPAESVTVSEGATILLARGYQRSTYVLSVAIDPITGGSVVADPAPDRDGRYAQDTVVALTATPASGYRVGFWLGVDAAGNGSAVGSATNTQTVTMTGNRSVTVQFEIAPFVTYQLAANVRGGHGSISPTRGAYHAGEVVTLLATPAAGYEVRSWTGTDDDTSTAVRNTVTMTAHKSVEVQFAQPPDCNGNGLDDRDEVSVGAAEDCNGNGVPDDCEPDSDGDGVIDDCDATPTGEPPLAAPLPSHRGGACGFGTPAAWGLILAGLSGHKRNRPSATRPKTGARRCQGHLLAPGAPRKVDAQPARSTISPFWACIRFSA